MRCNRDTLSIALISLVAASGCLADPELAEDTDDTTGAVDPTGAVDTTASPTSGDGEAPPDPDPVVANVPLELIDDIDPAMISQYEFTWTQGDAFVPMGSSADRVCFLTYVSGKFEGWGEQVRTFISGGTWYLGGESQQHGVRAKARCLPVTSASQYTGEVTWVQGNYPKSLGPSSDRVCFLTRMKGKFMGNQEWIHVYGSQGHWYLSGNSYQQDVTGGARCIKSVDYSAEKVWTQGNLATLMGGSTVQACFLSKVAGKFRGAGEWVHAYKSGDSWYLGGESYQSGVGARGRCVYK